MLSMRLLSMRSRAVVALLSATFLANIAMAQEELYSIVEVTASPVFPSYEAAVAGFADDAVMLRQEFAHQQLSRISSTNPRLDKLRRELLSDYSACNQSLRTIRQLDGDVPDFEGVVAKTIAASPALYKAAKATEEAPAVYTQYDRNSTDALVEKVVIELFKAGYNAYQASEERSSYRTHYRTARNHALEIESLVRNQSTSSAFTHYGMGCRVDFSEDGRQATVNSLLPESPALKAGLKAGDILLSANGVDLTRDSFATAMGVTREMPKKPLAIRLRRGEREMRLSIERSMPIVMPLLQVDINGSFDGWFPSDLVYVTNKSGVDLTNVVLFADIKGRHGPSAAEMGDRHMHFFKKWPSGETRVLRYMSTATSGIASDESVDQISQLQFRIYSDQFTQTEDYQYTAEDFRSDVQKYLKDTKFTGSWHSYPDGHLLFNSGFTVKTSDGGSFPATSVTITAWSGNVSKAVTFDITSDVFDGEEYLSHKDFNGLDVTRVEVKFHLPYTSHTLDPFWTW